MHLRVVLLPAVRLLVVIVLSAGARAVADTSGADAPRQQVRWYVDRGLNIEVRRFGLLEEVAGPASELLFHVQAGFRLSVDGAAFAGDDQGSDPGGVRRAYLRVEGEFWPWRRPVKFYLEIGVINSQFSVDTSYLTFPALPYVGDLKVGQLDPPMSMDALSSSFAPFNNAAPLSIAGRILIRFVGLRSDGDVFSDMLPLRTAGFLRVARRS